MSMELIDREKLLDELGESASYHAENGREYQLLLRDRNIVREQKEVKAIPISKGATNGDIIKAMFPWVEVKEKNNGYEVYFGIGTASQYFNYQWWNAPNESEGE